MDDPFLSTLERLLDAKCDLMETLAEELATARDSSAIHEVLCRAGERFRHFSETLEIPFEQQFPDRFKAVMSGTEFITEKRGLTIDTLLSALQRLKFDEPYVGDPHVTVAVAEFERATAQIPARTLG